MAVVLSLALFMALSVLLNRLAVAWEQHELAKARRMEENSHRAFTIAYQFLALAPVFYPVAMAVWGRDIGIVVREPGEVAFVVAAMGAACLLWQWELAFATRRARERQWGAEARTGSREMLYAVALRWLALWGIANAMAFAFWMQGVPRWGLWMLFSGYLPMLSPLVLRKRLQKSILGERVGLPQPMEESPLRDEIVAIASLCGIAECEPMVLPVSRANLAEESKIDPEYLEWVRTFAPRKPVFPTSIIRRYEADWLTAYAAVLFSQRAEMHLHPRFSRGWWVRVLGLGIAISAAMGVCLAAAGAMTNNRNIVIAVQAVATSSMILLFAPAMRKLGLMPTQQKAYARAFAAWRDAAPRESRTLADFTRCVLEFDAMARSIDEWPLMVGLLRGNAGFMEFLRAEAGPGGVDSLLGEIAARRAAD